jgi:hypothetical protein
MGGCPIHSGPLAVSDPLGLADYRTVSEVSGQHVCHIPHSTTGDEGWDRFSFSVKLEDYKRKIDERQLLICVRFSVDGQEWWDSNEGENYKFTFKKNAPKRVRAAAPVFNGGFMRVNEPAAENSIPGLRTRGDSQAASINRAFGVVAPKKPAAWQFPKFGKQSVDPPSRPDSPMQSPPPAMAFQAPPIPDVRTHLQLSNYCAPSPPQSPPAAKDALPQVTSPVRPVQPVETARHLSSNDLAVKGHERRRSWAGDYGEWDSFATVMENVEAGTGAERLANVNESLEGSVDGDSTPTAAGSRSPAGAVAANEDSSPEGRPLQLKRSTGNLLALINQDSNGLMTPPASNLSSPPSPGLLNLPGRPMSPSPSASTCESSPVHTLSSDSTPDLAHLAVDIEPHNRGRPQNPNSYKILTNSYQEFVSGHGL